MIQRPTQASIFNLVRSGLRLNQARLARAQEQVATGKRILRPSDDAVGTSLGLAVRRQQGGVEAYRSAISTARPVLSLAASHLQDASGMLSEARALIMQGMNGALNPEDKEAIAGQLDLLYEGLLDLANSRSGERYLFSGTATDTPPYQEAGDGRAVYTGNQNEQSIMVGRGVQIGVNVPGDEIFGSFDPTGVSFDGITGVKPGTSANSGVGYHDLLVRHTKTNGAPDQGVALANGGFDDTIMGPHTVTVDGLAGTAQLGTGPAVAIPQPPPASLELTDADGSKVFLDFSAWSGAGTTFVLTGAGAITLNGAAYAPIDLTETDLELVDEKTGTVLHLDTTGITRAAPELVTFGGTANIFDTLRGVSADLRNDLGFDAGESLIRIKERLVEFDRNQSNLLMGMGKLGGRTERLDSTEQRLGELSVHLDALVSSIEDADLGEVILDMSRAEQTLQIAQGTGARLLDQTLLNFLR